jgi:hypothetical protein
MTLQEIDGYRSLKAVSITLVSSTCGSGILICWVAWEAPLIKCLDSHVPKVIRSLLYHANSMSTTQTGGFLAALDANGKEVIPGVSAMDGTIFLRAAGKVIDHMGWTREGQKKGSWDMSPVGYDEVWR